MANKRNLKKQIRNICGDLAAECAIAIQIVPMVDKDKMSEIISRIAGLQESTLSRVSFSYDKSERDFNNRHEFIEAKKAYNLKAYRSLVADFNKTVEKIVDDMNAAMPKVAKEAKKEASE